MSLTESLAWSLDASMGMLKSSLADFSDADCLTRPVPSSNHPNWQLGHLIAAQHGMLSGAGAKLSPLPAGFEAKYKKETSTSDDAAAFLTKDQLLAAFDQLHQASMAFIKSATPAQLSAPSPEQVRSFAPTVVDLLSVQPIHIAMHLGQIQVLRRKLGKPVLF
jgi:DinB superfamily